MTEAQRYLADAEGLLNDAVQMRERIKATRPESLPLAQQVVDDSVRVYALAEAVEIHTDSTRLRMAALLTRALVLSEALNGGVQ